MHEDEHRGKRIKTGPVLTTLTSLNEEENVNNVVVTCSLYKFVATKSSSVKLQGHSIQSTWKLSFLNLTMYIFKWNSLIDKYFSLQIPEDEILKSKNAPAAGIWMLLFKNSVFSTIFKLFVPGNADRIRDKLCVPRTY